MGVSENNGTPKSSIFIGFSIINHPFWGTPILETPIYHEFAELLIYLLYLYYLFRWKQGGTFLLKMSEGLRMILELMMSSMPCNYFLEFR